MASFEKELEHFALAVRRLASRVVQQEAASALMATVKQASPLLVTLDTSTNGATMPVYHLSSYTPTLNDRVVVLQYRNTYLVLGLPE